MAMLVRMRMPRFLESNCDATSSLTGSSIATASGDDVWNRFDEDLREPRAGDGGISPRRETVEFFLMSAGEEDRRSVLIELEHLLRGLGEGRGDETLRNCDCVSLESFGTN
jgi:hypothetical protein